MRPWHGLIGLSVVPAASFLFRVCFSVVIGTPYRIASGSPGDGEQSVKQRLSLSVYVRIRG